MLNLSTSPELEQRIQTEAQKFGLTAEQHALSVLERNVAPVQPEQSDEEFEAGLDELFGCLVDVKPIGPSWREIKEEEMALEEAKHARLFGGSSSK